MLVRNKENRNISVTVGHGYTVEKVARAMKFVSTAGRNTKLSDWVEMYNYLKNADEKVVGCKACAGAKYTASVRNYARLGYLTLLNEGHTPEEFGIGEGTDKKAHEPIENEQERIKGVVLEEKKDTEKTPVQEEEKKEEEPVSDETVSAIAEALEQTSEKKVKRAKK